MKNLKIMSMLFGSLMLLGSLSSCGSDEPEELIVTSAKAEYVVNLSQNLLDAATVTVYYIDANGQPAQENATSAIWTKTVNYSTLPTDAGFNVQSTLKGEPTMEEYLVEADGQMTVTVLDQYGKPFGSPFVGNKQEAKGQLGPNFLGQFLTRISIRLFEAKAIAADGTVSDTTITWGNNADNVDPNRDTEISTDGATGTTRGDV